MKELLEICGALKTLAGKPSVLATVINVEGSAYRRPGARMLITPEGHSWGMISGGCLEHDVLAHARGVLQSGIPKIVRYDSTSEDDILFGTGLGCNGVIDVFIEPVTEAFAGAFIEAVEGCRNSREATAIATVVEDRDGAAAFPQYAVLTPEGWIGSEALIDLLPDSLPSMEVVLSLDRERNRIRIFVQPVLPPVQLVIFGGWLDVVPLIRFAREIGFQVLVVDSRQRESSSRFFGEAHSVLLCSPMEARSQIQFDTRTVAVLMNHNFERDQEALAALTRVSIPFLGMLGPRRRQERLLEALTNEGVSLSEEFRGNLHGPVGLDLGAKTPEEIALSIIGEILAVLNGRNGEPVRDRAMPLHLSTPVPVYA